MTSRLALAAWILNAFDVLSTLLIVNVFGGHELNPVMASLIARSPVLFGVAKVAGVSAGLAVLVGIESVAGLVVVVTFYSVLAVSNGLALAACVVAR